MTTGCGIPDCAGRRYARGWCITHYRRWQRHGDPNAGGPVRRRTTDGTSYSASRARLRADRGPVATRVCAECGAVAACWSYDGADPQERVHPVTGRRYSLDLDRYRPRCRFCHRRAVVDRGAVLPTGVRAVAGLDVERAALLYRRGASSPGIAALMGVSPDAVRRALREHGIELRSRPAQRHPSRQQHPPTRTNPSSHENQPTKDHENDQSEDYRTTTQQPTRPMHHDPMVAAASPDGPAAPEVARSC